jgi:hypothetical protein
MVNHTVLFISGRLANSRVHVYVPEPHVSGDVFPRCAVICCRRLASLHVLLAKRWRRRLWFAYCAYHQDLGASARKGGRVQVQCQRTSPLLRSDVMSVRVLEVHATVAERVGVASQHC